MKKFVFSFLNFTYRFLPLAHVFELLAESVCLLNGISIGYSTPLTLIDSSSKIMRGCKGDASVLKPTCMTTVPVSHFCSQTVRMNETSSSLSVCLQLILDRISKGINDKVNGETPFKKAFFKFAYAYKAKWIQRGYTTPLLDT